MSLLVDIPTAVRFSNTLQKLINNKFPIYYRLELLFNIFNILIMKLVFKTNEVTGQKEADLTVTLKSIGENILENSKGTKYRIATVEYPNKDGELVTRTARIYEKNVQKNPVLGEDYLATLTMWRENGQIKTDLVVSTLNAADRATTEDFDFDEAEIPMDAVVV